MAALTALVPIPASVTVDAAAPFTLAASTRLIAGAGAGATAALAAQLIETVTGRLLPIASQDAGSADIVLEMAGAGPAESYRLRAGTDGVRVTGADPAGLFYGMQTLAQLLAGDGRQVPAVTIADAPRFAYRGAMLDVARHFFPVATVTGVIDRAASLKLNHLHLHLTDDQGWRIRLSSRPKLTEQAAGECYTAADYAQIVDYAAARHVTIVPEVGGPGHTHAVGVAYPELAGAPVITDAVRAATARFGGELPVAGQPYRGVAVGFSSLRCDSDATYDFLADVFGELAAMTPGPYLHVGGDEALGTPADDFAEYIRRVTALVTASGKTPIAWHEAGAAAGLAAGTIGQYWGFRTPRDGMDGHARAFVANGGRMILSPADAIYLDMKYDLDTPLGLTWADGPTSVERSYRWEPVDVVPGAGPADILGIEAPLWTETVRTAADIDALAFPRVAAAAEIAWSPAPADHPQRNWASFRARVGGLGALWRRAGIDFFRSPEIDWEAP
ncbi:beta-N-acetylhexosaminidase [Microbacterium kribbense]|uniref:beta-N-acetylhexosaminidase n=1 Tax=Microbacterium kribbense TaxID=433645 RepID=A0ABP7GHI6_9MICO